MRHAYENSAQNQKPKKGIVKKGEEKNVKAKVTIYG
jgi:hypothetical protein